jgi:hypothetical protein
MSELNNDESLPGAHRTTPKRHNAKLCPMVIRQRIVNALAAGDSKRAIASLHRQKRRRSVRKNRLARALFRTSFADFNAV